MFTIAAAFLIIAIDLITIGLTKKSPILKYLLDLSSRSTPIFIVLAHLI